MPVDQLLDLVGRVLALNSRSLSKRVRADLQQLTLASLLPDVHSSVLDVLTAPIGVCKGQLLCRSTRLMNLLVQLLQSTLSPLAGRDSVVQRPYSSLRCRTYQALSYWLAASRSSCGLGAKNGDTLVAQLMSDIMIYRPAVQLVAGVGTNGQSGKKTAKKLKLSNDSARQISRKIDTQANCQVCRESLDCLSKLLLYCGSRLKPSTHKVTSTLAVVAVAAITSPC